jgi:hypothetical protein
VATLTEAEVQELRADIGDYKAPLILPQGALQRAWDRAGDKPLRARVYALLAIIAKFTVDRDPRLPQYKELLEAWQDLSGFKRGEIETGVIDLGLTLDPDEYEGNYYDEA